MVKITDRRIRFAEGELGRYGEDWQYNLSLLAAGYEFIYTPGYLSAVGIRSDSYTNWGMQARLSWSIIVQICSLSSDWERRGVTKARLRILLRRHWFKFAVACVVSEDYGFDISKRELQGFVPRYIGVLMRASTLLRKLNVGPLFRYAWLLYRKRSIRRVEV